MGVLALLQKLTTLSFKQNPEKLIYLTMLKGDKNNEILFCSASQNGICVGDVFSTFTQMYLGNL